jgi:hypothetical protein
MTSDNNKLFDLDKLLGKYKPLYDNRSMTNWCDVVVNLINSAYSLRCMNETKKAKEHLKYVKIYLNLLDDFPKFKEHELTRNTKDTCGEAVEYVKRQYKRLRGKLPE